MSELQSSKKEPLEELYVIAEPTFDSLEQALLEIEELLDLEEWIEGEDASP